MRGESVYRAGSESRAQPLDQVLPLAGRFALLEQQPEVGAGKWYHVVGSQRDFAHRPGEREIEEPLAQEQREMLNIARRHDQADRDLSGRLVAVPEPEDETLHAPRTRGEEPGELHDQPPRGKEQRLG